MRVFEFTHKKIASLLLPLFFLIGVLTFFIPSSVYAQNTLGAGTLGVAHMIQTTEKNVKDGTVLSAGIKGAVLSTIPYDGHVVGIVSRDAAIIFNTTATDTGVPAISQGTVYVLVSSQNGQIKKGDQITTSTTPGIAMKATKDGYILGTALENAPSTNPKQIDKIAVDLDLHYFNSKPTFPGSLTDIFKLAILSTRESPTALFKYIVAAIVVLGSFAFGFLTFGRTAAKGVEALGRNPAASKIIHLGIIFNISIVVVIVLVGLTVAFLILRL